MTQSIAGEWNLSASTSLTAAELEEALREAAALEIFHVPSDSDEVDEAVAALKSATSRPVWMDGADAANWEEAINQAMADYPTDVVILACKAWRQVPQHGKWWPTEQDLRGKCEELFKPRKTLFNRARMLLRDLRDKEAAEREQTPSAFPDDRHRKFRTEMERTLSPERYSAYFNGSQIVYRGDEILVRTQVADVVLNREGGRVLRALGLRLSYEPEAFENILVVYRKETERERVEVGEAMTALANKLKGKP